MIEINLIHYDEQQETLEELSELTDQPLMYADMLLSKEKSVEDNEIISKVTSEEVDEEEEGIADLIGDIDIMGTGKVASPEGEEDEDGDINSYFAIDKMIDEIIEPSEETIGSDISSNIISGQIGRHKKRQNSEDKFRKEFADELTLLYDLIKDMEQVEKEIRSAMGINDRRRKIRGVSKNINDAFTNIINLKKQRLDIVKEITRLRKDIIDLGLKERRLDKDSGEGAQQNIGLAGSALIQEILQTGRKSIVDAVTAPEREVNDLMSTISEDDNNSAEKFENMRRIAHNTYSDDEEMSLEEKMIQRLSTEDTGRSKEGDLNLKYERDGVEVRVRRFVDTDEYEFFAVNKRGEIVPDYPLPDIDRIGEIKFSGKLAVDRRGVQYVVEDEYSDEAIENTDQFYE